MSMFGGNYTPEEWIEVKCRRRSVQEARAQAASTDQLCHRAIRAILDDRKLCLALRRLSQIKPRHTLLRLPARRTVKVAHYQRSRKVTSQKSNPELVKGASTTRTMHIEADVFTGMDLSKEEQELFGVMKIWCPYVSEDELPFRLRLVEHLRGILGAWEAAGKSVDTFLAQQVSAKQAKPKEKAPPKYDAMNRVAVSLDSLMEIGVR